LLPKGNFKVTIKAQVERSVFGAIIYLETPKDGVYWLSPASKKIAKRVGPISQTLT
jgi:hypothetical protein